MKNPRTPAGIEPITIHNKFIFARFYGLVAVQLRSPNFCNMVMRYWVFGPGRFDTMLSRNIGHHSPSDAAPHQEEQSRSSAKDLITQLITYNSFYLLIFCIHCIKQCCRSQSPRGLRRGSAAARLLGLWVRIPPGAWMFVCCECCVLSGRDFATS